MPCEDGKWWREKPLLLNKNIRAALSEMGPIWAGRTQWSGADTYGKSILNSVSSALASSPGSRQTVAQGLPEAEFPCLLNRLWNLLPTLSGFLRVLWTLLQTFLLYLSASFPGPLHCWGGRTIAGMHRNYGLCRGSGVSAPALYLPSFSIKLSLREPSSKSLFLSGNSSFGAHHCVCLGKGLGCLPVYITLYL